MTTETIARYQLLANDAKPVNDDEWGSERQIAAQNAFHAAMQRDGLITPAYEAYCLKATVEEMVDEGMRLVIRRFSR